MRSITAGRAAAPEWGFGGAVAFGVFGYVLAIAALAALPETHGREIRPLE